ncbi:MAG: hypothetical protein ACK4OM_01645 [Alphaproteobacteria bacterium]
MNKEEQISDNNKEKNNKTSLKKNKDKLSSALKANLARRKNTDNKDK